MIPVPCSWLQVGCWSSGSFCHGQSGWVSCLEKPEHSWFRRWCVSVSVTQSQVQVMCVQVYCQPVQQLIRMFSASTISMKQHISVLWLQLSCLHIIVVFDYEYIKSHIIKTWFADEQYYIGLNTFCPNFLIQTFGGKRDIGQQARWICLLKDGDWISGLLFRHGGLDSSPGSDFTTLLHGM